MLGKTGFALTSALAIAAAISLLPSCGGMGAPRAAAPARTEPAPTTLPIAVAKLPADMPAHNWKMSVVTNEASSWTKAARLFADQIKEHTDGRITVTVYPNGELAGGDQVKELQMLQEGTINLTYHSNLLYTNLDQSFAAISLPWQLSRYPNVDAALAGPAGDRLLKTAEAKGIVGLAFGENGFRQITNSKREIRKPDDLKGLKIRIPGVKMYTSIFNALGAAPVTRNFGEVYEALRTGELDGQENPIDIIVSAKLYEVQKYISLWNYSYDALVLGVNKRDWDGLPLAAQQIVKQAAVIASKAQVRLSREAAQTQVNALREKGMVVTELTADEVAAFQARMAPVYTEWTPQVGATLLKQLQAQ